MNASIVQRYNEVLAEFSSDEGVLYCLSGINEGILEEVNDIRREDDDSTIPIAADESVFTSADAVNIVRTGCADVINIRMYR